MLKLGNIGLEVPFFQAPLSGYSDYAMRKLGLSFGAPLTFAGVMLAKSATHPKVLRKPFFRPRDDEHPIGAQILGNDPLVMAAAAKELVAVGYDLIDLNFACPAPKVLRRRRGGWLLREPERIIEIYSRVRDAVSCPVLMKLRTGFNSSGAERDNFYRIVSVASEENIDAVVVHPRTVVQKFTGQADWELLAELKQQFPQTTIIGSGDLFDAQTGADLLKTTGVDGLLIARGAVGNPWIFRDLRAVLAGKPIPERPGIEEQGRTILEHFELVAGIYKLQKAVRFIRKFLVNYCKLHPKRKEAQKTLLAAGNKKELLAGIKHWYGVS